MYSTLKKAALYAFCLPVALACTTTAFAASATITSVSGSGSATATFSSGGLTSSSTFTLPTSAYCTAASQSTQPGVNHQVTTSSGIWFFNQTPPHLFWLSGAQIPPSGPIMNTPMTSISCLLGSEAAPIGIDGNGTGYTQQSVNFSFVIDSLSQWQLFIAGEPDGGSLSCSYHLTGPSLDLTLSDLSGDVLEPINLLPGTYNVSGLSSASYTSFVSSSADEADFGLTLIPEPASLSLLAVGMLALTAHRRRH